MNKNSNKACFSSFSGMILQETRDKRQETRDKRQETRDKRQETRRFFNTFRYIQNISRVFHGIFLLFF